MTYLLVSLLMECFACAAALIILALHDIDPADPDVDHDTNGRPR